MSSVSDFEKWMREFLSATPEIETAVGERVFNSVAPPNTAFPYLIYNVVPLTDKFGQARASVQTRLLADVQIYAKIPFPETVDAAIEAVKEKIAADTRGIVYGSSIISLRHERPISRSVKGAMPDDHPVARGSTYKVWVSRNSGD